MATKYSKLVGAGLGGSVGLLAMLVLHFGYGVPSEAGAFLAVGITLFGCWCAPENDSHFDHVYDVPCECGSRGAVRFFGHDGAYFVCCKCDHTWKDEPKPPKIYRIDERRA